MVKVRKSSGGSGDVPRLDILAARLRIIEAELTLEEKLVNLDDGRSFTADPNLNCRLQVVKNIVEPGVHEGATFFDRFKLKKDENGDWAFLEYSKLGNLIVVRYGRGWFEDPNAEFEESDFEDFDFVAQVEPKTNPKGNPLNGSVVNWKSMRQASEGEEVVQVKVAQAQAEEDADFEDIPF